MRLDEVYGTLAAFSDDDLRAFVEADRKRRSALERAADQVFLGWLVRRLARDPLAEARFHASEAVRLAGLPKPHPTRAATRGLLEPLVSLVAVSISGSAFTGLLLKLLPLNPIDRAVISDAGLSIGVAAGALVAFALARLQLREGQRDPADVFGQRLQGALAAMYAITALLALLPLAFMWVVVALPDLAEIATDVVFVTGLVLIVLGLRAALRARALSGVWRPFEDAALAAVAHGQISELDERLLTQPLVAVAGRAS